MLRGTPGGDDWWWTVVLAGATFGEMVAPWSRIFSILGGYFETHGGEIARRPRVFPTLRHVVGT